MRQLDGTCSWPSNCYLACFEGTIPEGRWQEPILLFCVYLWDGLRSQENFFKLKFHFFKSKNELFCFYCLYQGSFPTIAQVLTEVVSPTQLPKQPLNWKCLVSRHPESFCSLIGPLFTVPRVSKYTTRAQSRSLGSAYRQWLPGRELLPVSILDECCPFSLLSGNSSGTNGNPHLLTVGFASQERGRCQTVSCI